MMVDQNKMEALLRSLLSPEELGHAVTAEVRDRARVALGRAPAETPPDSSSKPYNDLAVEEFASAMKRKLETKRLQGRFGWENSASCSAEDLSMMLAMHVIKGDPIDVANFAMMLHQRGERIASALDAQLTVADGWKLVPIEPTAAMIERGGYVNSEWLNDNAPIGQNRYATPMKAAYQAMLGAAPVMEPLPVASATTNGATVGLGASA
jgi:hypothetical protein